VAPQCDYCDRPATYHAAWQTPSMPAPKIAHTCDEHRFEGMIPVGEPVEKHLEHLPDLPGAAATLS
jgi:hypothetical protein